MFTPTDPMHDHRRLSPADFALTSVRLEAERRAGRLVAEAESRRATHRPRTTLRGRLGRTLVSVGVAVAGRELQGPSTGLRRSSKAV